MNIQLEVSLNLLNCFIKFLFRILKKSQVKCLFYVVSASKNQSIFQKTAFLFVEIQILKKGRLLRVVFQLFRGQSIHEKDKKYATSKIFLTPLCRLKRATPCYCKAYLYLKYSSEQKLLLSYKCSTFLSLFCA